MDQPGYKFKLKELQANIKRSKLEHRELEYEFQKLILQRNDCDRSAMKAYRSKYNSGLEEDKRRNARNEKIKQMLERIDYQASALAAKSERLKMLKTHYEKNLYRAFGPNSSRTDNSSDRHIQKPRTKSVDAHTQIPRPNYEVFDNVDDTGNEGNYVSSKREPRSVSTSRINNNYNNTFPNHEQRSISVNADISGNSETKRDLEPPSQPVNKGVRLFYGNELINLPNLKVDNDFPIQDSNTRCERSLEEKKNVNFTPTFQENVDYRIFQNPNPQLPMKDLRSNELSSDDKTYRQYAENSKYENNSLKQPFYPQYQNNNNNSTYSPPTKSSIEHITRSQYQDGKKDHEDLLYNKSVINTRSPYVEFHDKNNTSTTNQPLQSTTECEPRSQYQDKENNQPSIYPPFTQNQINNNTDIHNSPSVNSNPVEINATDLQKSDDNNQRPQQKLSETKPEPVHLSSYVTSTENLAGMSNNNNRPPNIFQQETENGSDLQNFQTNQFIPNTIPEIRPISAIRIDANQSNKPSAPQSHSKIFEVPSTNIPQGIHQVWEKVVDVEIVNQPPKPYPSDSNEPRNDVIDKIYKEISSLGEIPVDEGQVDERHSLKIDNQAEIIDKIEEHYYGEKIKSNENETDLYSNTNLNNNQNYEPHIEQSQSQVEQHNIDYTGDVPMYQDPNTNYEISNQNEMPQVEYQNYDINEQYYSQSQDPNLTEQQGNYVPQLSTDYNNEQSTNDPNYVYAQNENYQQFTTDGNDETLYQVEPDSQNHDNQLQSQPYTDDMTNQYYEQQQSNEAPMYAENPNESSLQYSNDFYNQSGNYDQQNVNPEEYQVQYNENTPEMYQDYSNNQQPQIESTIPYENTVDYTLNEPQEISKPIETPSLYEPDEMSVNQPSPLSSTEQTTPPIIEENKTVDEIKQPDTIVPPKPQTEPKKKRVNFLDSSDSEQPSGEEKQIPKSSEKEQSDSDFEFSVKSN